MSFLGDTQAATHPVSLFRGREERRGLAGGAAPAGLGDTGHIVHTHTRSEGVPAPTALPPTTEVPVDRQRKTPTLRGTLGKTQAERPRRLRGLCSSPAGLKLETARRALRPASQMVTPLPGSWRLGGAPSVSGTGAQCPGSLWRPEGSG